MQAVSVAGYGAVPVLQEEVAEYICKNPRMFLSCCRGLSHRREKLGDGIVYFCQHRVPEQTVGDSLEESLESDEQDHVQ